MNPYSTNCESIKPSILPSKPFFILFLLHSSSVRYPLIWDQSYCQNAVPVSTLAAAAAAVGVLSSIWCAPINFLNILLHGNSISCHTHTHTVLLHNWSCLCFCLSVYGARNIFAHITKSYINRAGFKVYLKIYRQAAVKVDFVALRRHTAGARAAAGRGVGKGDSAEARPGPCCLAWSMGKWWQNARPTTGMFTSQLC